MPQTITWKKALSKIKNSVQFKQVIDFVSSQRQQGKTIFPPSDLVFNAFKLTEYHQVKVVVLGQDPYHGENQANGLAFSVNQGIKIPPSLINIYKEIQSDIGNISHNTGDLSGWANQGVLLLNTVLTVEQAQAHSHKNKGWEFFTDKVIQSLNYAPQKIVFLLWGKPAQSKEALITNPNHTILKAPHPSPLSAHRGFLGCKHFSRTNQILLQNQQQPINW